MDFFGHQEKARRASGRLVVLFALAVAGMIVCIHFAAMGVLMCTGPRGANGQGAVVFALVAASTLAVIGCAMLFKTAQMRSGGGQVERLVGVKPVSIERHDLRERHM